ncbi:ABC transporter substrate-binding protein [Brevibacterium daeguense]|uniref:ABC transporter substrate-binding protein n=1 Tax=Brevibacterium daeguense TaxID=909936 RepID=A0ABP8EK40_9MICO|nr:ABC transporter substrate-binding protein [Brevibacterium daeguense]
MLAKNRRLPAAIAASAALILGLSACGNSEAESASAAAEETGGETSTVQIEDNNGTQDVVVPPQSVVATDNRLFETLDTWGVELKAAPKQLVPEGISYRDDEEVIDLGSHREPDLEAVVAAEPDLIINGQRFSQYHEDFTKLAPEATVLALDPRDGEAFDEELKRQTEALGTIFDREDDAQQLVEDFDASIERVKGAYDAEDTVMSVITSGGEINYSAPGEGRTLGPVYEVLGLTPALETEDSSANHQGDDISVEAIAESNPDWILVLDRDAGVSANSEEEYTPANELLADSEALQNVQAVQDENIVYMPQDTYVNESIQTYTEFFNTVADAMEKD